MKDPHPSPALGEDACIIVFSGGQDSTTCLHWAMAHFKEVEAIFFDYGQRHIAEKEAAISICTRNDIALRIFTLNFFRELGGNALTDADVPIVISADGLPSTFVPGRNIIFLTYAAAYAHGKAIKHLVTGVCQTDFSGYPDCREETIRSLEQTLGLGMGMQDRFSIHTPLMFKTKAESVLWAVELGAMESMAYSHTCYTGSFPPCGLCPACSLRKRGFEEAGIEDPLSRRAREQSPVLLKKRGK